MIVQRRSLSMVKYRQHKKSDLRAKSMMRVSKHAVAYCLQEANLNMEDIDHVVFYDKPLTKFDRILETYLSVCPAGFRSFLKAIPVWLGEKLWMDKIIGDALIMMGIFYTPSIMRAMQQVLFTRLLSMKP